MSYSHVVRPGASTYCRRPRPTVGGTPNNSVGVLSAPPTPFLRICQKWWDTETTARFLRMALCVREALHAGPGGLDGEDTKSSLCWQCDQTEKASLGCVPRSSLRFCSTAFAIPALTMVAASLLDRTATTFGICRREDGGLCWGWFMRADGNNFKRVGRGGPREVKQHRDPSRVGVKVSCLSFAVDLTIVPAGSKTLKAKIQFSRTACWTRTGSVGRGPGCSFSSNGGRTAPQFFEDKSPCLHLSFS